MNGQIGRRAFLRQGTLVLAAAGFEGVRPGRAGEPAAGGIRVGLITDLHYADKPSAGTRHYRETLTKLAEAAGQFARDKPAIVVELGDLVDAADSVATELAYLKRVNKEFAALARNRHYVVGNHCVDTLTKDEFLGEVGQKESSYSFDAGGVHFIVLDACFRSDGKPYGRKNSKWNDANLPADQLDWLAADLKRSAGPVVVFVHQRLDVAIDYGIRNAAAVRKILEESGKVRAVFQGHSHKNDYREIAGIHYCTLVAMVEGSGAESSGYSLLDVRPDGSMTLTGFRKQMSHDWRPVK
jgi:alkaline phosphatase